MESGDASPHSKEFEKESGEHLALRSERFDFCFRGITDLVSQLVREWRVEPLDLSLLEPLDQPLALLRGPRDQLVALRDQLLVLPKPPDRSPEESEKLGESDREW